LGFLKRICNDHIIQHPILIVLTNKTTTTLTFLTNIFQLVDCKFNFFNVSDSQIDTYKLQRISPKGLFTNILHVHFLYKNALQSFSHFGFVIFWRKNIRAKGACKMLMKLTPWMPVA